MQRRIAKTLEQRKSKGESGKVTAEAATANAPPRSEKKSEVKEERSDTDQPEADYGDQDELEDSHDDDEEHQRVQEQIRKDLQSEDGEEERYKRRECILKSADLDRRLEDERDERRRTRSRSPRHEDWRGHWRSQSPEITQRIVEEQERSQRQGIRKVKGGTLGMEATYDHSGRSVQDPTRKMPQVRCAKLQTHEHGMLSAILVQDRFASHPYQCGTMVVD